MAFKLAIGNIIDFPVHIRARDGASIKDFRFNLQAERISADQARDLFSESGQFGNQTIDEFLRQRLTGWRNQTFVLSEDDTPAPFGPDALAAMLGAPGVSMTLYMTYLQAVIASDGSKGVQKN